MANQIARRTVLRPTEPIKVGQWSIQIWCKIIGVEAGRFTAVATNPQGTQLTAHGLPSSDLAPGDIIFVEEGDAITADCRLFD